MYFLALWPGSYSLPQSIPVMPYAQFYEEVLRLLQNPANRLVSYYGVRDGELLRFMCAIMNARDQCILVGSYTLLQEPGILLASLSGHQPAAQGFERQIADSLGITFASLPAAVPQPTPANVLTTGFSVN